jgi:hypothetical protein
MLPAAISIQNHFSPLSFFFPKKESFTIDYQPESNTLIIKGKFNSEESRQALKQCREIIEQHLFNHKEIHLFMYLKEYDLANVYTWTSVMDELEHTSERIIVNWFMNGTNQSSYRLANEVLHAYRVRSFDVV